MKFNIDDYMGNYAMHCKTKKEAKVVLKVNCGTIKQLAYNLAISEGADDCTAEYYSDIVYANCMG